MRKRQKQSVMRTDGQGGTRRKTELLLRAIYFFRPFFAAPAALFGTGPSY